MVMKIVLALLISEGLAGRLRVRLAREKETRTGTVTESIHEHLYIKRSEQLVPLNRLLLGFASASCILSSTDLSVSTLYTFAATELSFRSLPFDRAHISFHF